MPAFPRSDSVRSSRFVMIFAPVALASFSMSLFFTLLSAKILFFARKCWARSSMPFWQNTAFAPLFTTLATICLIIFSSMSRNACIWFGSVICILASVSVSLISREESISSIFGPATDFGMLGWTRSLSSTMPFISSVSSILPPAFFSSFISSVSIVILMVFSITWRIASTVSFESTSLFDSVPFPVIAVCAIISRTFVSDSDTGSDIFSNTANALSLAILYPLTTTVGCMSILISSSAFLRSSPASMTAVVVPSPTSSSWVFATSTIIFAAGCSICISFKMVTPSLVTITSPMESTSILSIPFGPSVVLTVSPTSLAASMLFDWAVLPCFLCVPSGRMYIGWLSFAMIIPLCRRRSVLLKVYLNSANAPGVNCPSKK